MGIRFQPPEGWKVKVEEMESEVFFMGPVKSGFYVNINIMVEDAPPCSLEEFVTMCKRIYPSQFSSSNYSLLSDRSRIIGGMEAHELVQELSELGFKIKSQQIIIMKNGKLYFITFTALQSHYESYKPIFERAIQTFKVESNAFHSQMHEQAEQDRYKQRSLTGVFA
jgi:hypothetical protein